MTNDLPEPQPFAPEAPLPMVPPLSSAPDYPVDALGPLQAAVVAVQQATQAPAAIPAQSALAVAALAVQGHARVETLNGSFAPLSLFCLTIADSGERKSTCDSMLRRGIDQFEAELRDQYKSDFASYRDKREIWKVKRDEAKARVRKAKDPQKSLAAEAEFQALGQEPAAPLKPIITVSEPTFEGLVALFAEGRPSLGLLHDEGGQFFSGHALIKENKIKTLAAFNSLWDGKAIQRTRAGDGAYTLPGRALSLHLLSQPSAALHFFTDGQADGLGFTARCLLTHPGSTQGTRFHENSKRDEAALKFFQDKLLTVLRLPLPTVDDGRELSPRELRLSTEAQSHLKAFYNKVENEQREGGRFATIRAFASKAAEHVCRIAGVITLFDTPFAAEVPGPTILDAMRLVTYYLKEAKRIAELAPVTADLQDAHALLIWLHNKHKGDVVLPSEILQHGPGRLRDLVKIKKLVKILVDHGHLVGLQEGFLYLAAHRKEAYQIVAKIGPMANFQRQLERQS